MRDYYLFTVVEHIRQKTRDISVLYICIKLQTSGLILVLLIGSIIRNDYICFYMKTQVFFLNNYKYSYIKFQKVLTHWVH